MGSSTKRLKTYDICRKNKAIGMLQETFTSAEDESIISSEWGGEIVCSHGTKKSAGVILLFPPNVNFENIVKDDAGRVVACYLPSFDLYMHAICVSLDPYTS